MNLSTKNKELKKQTNKGKSMKLSIITVSYNIKDEIERTCESIVNQTWQDFEWIVIDGGSTDGTLEVLEKYKSRINILISEPDKGLYDGMNKGVLNSTGEYLNFMNSGDEYHDKDVLEDIFINNNFNHDIVYGGELKVFKDCYQIVNTEFDFTSKIFWHLQYHLRHQTCFIKKELFNKYGLYDLQYRSASDFEAFMRFLYIHKCSSLYINRIVSKFYAFGGISSESSQIGENECKNILLRYDSFLTNLWIFLYKFFWKTLAQITPVRKWRKYMRAKYKGEFITKHTNNNELIEEDANDFRYV